MATLQSSPNIDERGVVVRLRRSLVAFAVALVIVAILQAARAWWPLYLLTALPFSLAFGLGYQGLFKT